MISFVFPISFKKMQETKLTITISNDTPIELIDFTETFFSLGQQYKRESYANYSSNSKLYVKEVRKGSTVVELMEITKVAMLPLFGDVNTIVSFAKNLQKTFNWFLGKAKEEEKPKYSIPDLENFKKILEAPANNTPKTIINFNTTINGDVILNFGVSNIEANAIQNAISKEIKVLQQTTPANQERVVFHWYAAKNDLRSQSWERGVIESIYYHPIKVIFETEDIKKAMIHPPQGNIFDVAFMVDVHIETVDGGKPILYKITNFHEYITKNDIKENQTEIENK